MALTGTPDKEIGFLVGNLPTTDVDGAEILIYHQLVRENGQVQQTLSAIGHSWRATRTPIVVCLLSDYEGALRLPKNICLLRTSIQKKVRGPREWPLPYLWDCRSEPFAPAPSAHKPTVGFCGLSNRWRQPLLDYFGQSPQLETDFMVRDQFWGGKPFDEDLIRDFWGNIRRNVFTIASRGAGNFSMRFYQALSVGRIPVLLDSAMELPLANRINWQEAIIMEKTPGACLEKMVEVHNSGSLVHMQEAAFTLFHHHFAPGQYLRLQCEEIIKAMNTKRPWYKGLIAY